MEELIIFTHIPKTGGATLLPILKKQYRGSVCGGGNQEHSVELLSKLKNKEVMELACIAGHLPYGIDRFFPRPAKYITLLRDPVECIISLYYFLLTHQKIEDISFRDFLVSNEYKSRTSNIQTRFLSWESNVKTERTKENLIKFLSNEQDHVPELDRAIKNLNNYYLVAGITDMYNESLYLMKEKLNWRNFTYKRRNITDRPASEEIPDEILQLIKARNSLDLRLYAFAKKRLKKQIAGLDPDSKQELADFIQNVEQTGDDNNGE